MNWSLSISTAVRCLTPRLEKECDAVLQRQPLRSGNHAPPFRQMPVVILPVSSLQCLKFRRVTNLLCVTGIDGGRGRGGGAVASSQFSPVCPPYRAGQYGRNSQTGATWVRTRVKGDRVFDHLRKELIFQCESCFEGPTDPSERC